MKVDVQEAKARLMELIERAARGEEVIIAEHGKPPIRLVKVEEAPRRPGIARGHVTEAFFEPLGESGLEASGNEGTAGPKS